MAKRSKKSRLSLGKMLVWLIVLAALGAGGWYSWNSKSWKKPELPKWASLPWLKKRFGSTNAPPEKLPTTNAPRQTNNITPPEIPRPTNSSPQAEVPEHVSRQFRNVKTILDAQIGLARKGISVGAIDGGGGYNMQRALLAWQIHNSLPVSGELDAESKAALLIEEPLYIQYAVGESDLRRLRPVPATWLGKSQLERLEYETILELVAEKGRSSPDFIRKLNPQISWTNVTAGALIRIPRIDPPVARERAAFVRVHLYSKTLDVFGKSTNLLAHYPCSIASRVEKRPVGTLYVAKAAANPTYLFDPEIFSESAEAKKLGRKLTIPPGPNNPVGTAWIGLDRPGYGIHGTPKPELVGRTESHGCFRLANWNAEHLLQLVWVGCPVIVEP